VAEGPAKQLRRHSSQACPRPGVFCLDAQNLIPRSTAGPRPSGRSDLIISAGGPLAAATGVHLAVGWLR
jgi:hypothetical protein